MGKVTVCLICAVNTVVNGNEAYSLFHKQDFGVKSHFQIIAPKSRHLLDYQCGHFAVLTVRSNSDG